MDQDLIDAAGRVLDRCRSQGVKLTTAESCTGGLLSAYLTEIPGSSDVFERGFVTYSNAAKNEQLGVPAELISEHGAVSEEVARAMAGGALRHAAADVSVSVTGVAGPGGGTPEKPVGLVHMAAARRGQQVHHVRCEFGDIGRGEIRRRSVARALELATLVL